MEVTQRTFMLRYLESSRHSILVLTPLICLFDLLRSSGLISPAWLLAAPVTRASRWKPQDTRDKHMATKGTYVRNASHYVIFLLRCPTRSQDRLPSRISFSPSSTRTTFQKNYISRMSSALKSTKVSRTY